MAKTMTAGQFLAALKAEGVPVRERKGWRTHNRNHKGASGPHNGVMVHHTASGSDGIESFVSNGNSALPGPLCHGLIEKSGRVVLIGWGRANHAGGGDPDVLAAVRAERWPVPKTNEHDGSAGSVDGNAHFVGYECVNQGNGKDPWPAIQLEGMARACAAVCRFHGWTVDSVIRHLDWSDWKVDPRGIDWNNDSTGSRNVANAMNTVKYNGGGNWNRGWNNFGYASYGRGWGGGYGWNRGFFPWWGFGLGYGLGVIVWAMMASACESG